jgi:hypothetical protein
MCQCASNGRIALGGKELCTTMRRISVEGKEFALSRCFPQLPRAARQAHIFKELEHQALISAGLLCDHGCRINLDEKDANIWYDGRLILKGKRGNNGLWTLNVQNEPKQKNQIHHPHQPIANATIESSTISDHIHYLHAAAFSPE